jgi:hypothetical protein
MLLTKPQRRLLDAFGALLLALLTLVRSLERFRFFTVEYSGLVSALACFRLALDYSRVHRFS